MPGAHRKRTPGRHRKATSRSRTWRTAGGLVAGAAVLGTAAATAQASVLPFPSAPAASTAPGATGEKHGGASKDSSKDGARKPAKNGSPKDGPGKDEPRKPAAKGSGKPSGEARPTAAQAIALARSQVGVTEDGGGETKFQKWYMGTARAKETLARDGGTLAGYGDANWCDMFVSWVGEQLGFTDQIGSDAWTVAHARWFREQGRWGTEPRPGAIVFYAWDGGKDVTDIRHVGIVVKKIDDGTIEAVEGNTGNAVQIKKRKAEDVVGYGYPDYRS